MSNWIESAEMERLNSIDFDGCCAVNMFKCFWLQCRLTLKTNAMMEIDSQTVPLLFWL